MLKIRTKEVLYENYRTEKLMARRATKNITEADTQKMLEGMFLSRLDALTSDVLHCRDRIMNGLCWPTCTSNLWDAQLIRLYPSRFYDLFQCSVLVCVWCISIFL